MTVKKAIDLLQSQKQKLVDKSFFEETVWLNQTSSLILDIFGEKSEEYKFISSFSFTMRESTYLDSSTIDAYKLEKSRTIFNFLHSCIDTIIEKGINKLPKQNFLNKLSDTAIWTIVGVGVPGLLSIGLFFGNMYSDKQNIELRQENKLLKKSLFTLRPLTNKITNNRPDTVIQKTITNDTPK